MKNILLFSKNILLVFLIFCISCTKDMDIKEVFEFDSNIKIAPEGCIFEPAPLEIKIHPKRTVRGTTYKISYSIEKGDSYLETGSPGVAIKENEKYNLSALEENFIFIPKKTGTNIVVIKFEDSRGVVKTQKISFEAKFMPFTFTVIPNLSSYTINAKGMITTTLSRKDKDFFKFSYTLENGTGKLFDKDKEIPLGKDYLLPNGKNELDYMPATLGKHKIKFSVIAPDGAVDSKELELISDNVPFSITATALTPTINLNEDVAISLNLEKVNKDSPVTYEIAYSFEATGVSGALLDPSGTPVVPGVFAPLKEGVCQYKLTPVSKGISTVIFQIRDSNGQIKEVKVPVTVQEIDFTFTGVAQQNAVFVNEITPLNFDLTESANSKTNYEMKYVINSGKAVIKNGSTVEDANVWYPVTIGQFSRTFVATTVGSVSAVFTVRNKTTLVEKSVPLTITVNPSDFSFNVNTSSNNQYVGTNIDVNLTLIQTGGSSDSYTLKFVSSGLATFLYNGVIYKAGELIPVTIGTTKGVYNGKTPGENNITFTAVNQFGTTKQASVKLNYFVNDFNLSATGDGTVYINKITDFNVIITQLFPDTSISYKTKFSFEDSHSNVQFLQNGKSIDTGIFYPVNSGSNSFSYKGTSIGPVTLVVTVQNSNGLEKTAKIVLNIINVEFSITATALTPTINLNEDVTISINLEKVNKTNPTTYEIAYSFDATGVSGTLSDSSGSPVVPGVFAPLKEGVCQYKLTPAGKGVSTVLFQVRDSNGQIKTASVPVTIQVVEYTFTGAPQQNAVFVNETTPVNFDLTESANSKTNYEMKYVINSGKAVIKNGSTVEDANIWYPVTIGAFSRTFVATTVGSVNAVFTVRNKTTLVEKSVPVTITVNPSDFSFNVNTSANNQYIGTDIDVNLTLIQTGGSSDSYTLKFISSGSATFLYNGVIYKAGDLIPFTTGTTKGVYNGKTSGENDITFTAVNQFGTTKNANVKLNYFVNDFNLSTTGDGTAYINKIADLSVIINQLFPDTSISYKTKISFEDSRSNGQLFQNGKTINPGVFYPVNPGSNSFSYKGNSINPVSLIVTTQNSNGLEKTAKINLNIINVEFSITAIALTPTINLNENATLSLNLIKDYKNSDISYEIACFFDSGGISGTLSDPSGNALVPGVYYPIKDGVSQYKLDPVGKGTSDITFKIKDSNGQIKTTNVAVTIQEIQYTFTGNPQQNAIFINETTPVNFNITESANSKTNYEMKYVINSRSAVIKNGSAVENPDVWYNVTVGTFSRTFVATHTGSVSGTFTVRNKTTLIEKSVPFSINVKPSDFDFSAATASATSNIVKGTPVNVNFNLTQTAGSGDTYNLKFESTGTGTFLYKNVSYMPGFLIPINVGASKGVYNGITSGDHDVTFTVENQLATTKQADISLNYNANDFTLTPTGDGSYYINDPAKLGIAINQLITDPSVTYKVMFSYDKGSSSNGEISNGATVLTGTFYPVTKGDNLFLYTGKSEGDVTLDVTVQNSLNLPKHAKINLNIKDVNFDFTADVTTFKKDIFVEKTAVMNVDFYETGRKSNLDYEMMFSPADIAVNGMTPNTFSNISIKSFDLNFTPLSEGKSDITFTIRNKTTKKTKSKTISIDAWVKPEISNVKTNLLFRELYGSRNSWEWYISCKIKKDSRATIKSIVFTCNNETFDVPNNGQNFLSIYSNSNQEGRFNGKIYYLTVTDSNNVSSVYSTRWTN